MKTIIKILFIVFFFSNIYKIFSCTLWAGSGNDFINQGGVIAVKVRDQKPDHRQLLKTVKPENGFMYFGLFAEGGEEPGLKAGINEKGLTVFTSTAGSIPEEKRKKDRGTKNFLSKILKNCESTDQIIEMKDVFYGPKNFIAADKNKILLFEIGLNGKYSYKIAEKGLLCHTNHYIFEDMTDFNFKTGTSSLKRYKRIEELLSSNNIPFSMDDFIKMSTDRNDGPDNSIFRTGKKAVSVRTLSIWIVRLHPEKGFSLYVRLINPGEKEKTVYLTEKEVFSGVLSKY